MKRRLSTITFVCAAAVCAGTILAQQANRTIRVDVDLVLVNVTVTNSKDQYIHGLEETHFRVFEDNIEQEIVHFKMKDAANSR